MRAMLCCITVAALLILNGCGKATHESVAQESFDNMQEVVTILEGVMDEASAKAAAAKIEALGKEMQALQAQAKELGEPSPEVKKALEEKFKPQMQEVMAGITKEMMRIGLKDPKLVEPLQKAFTRVN